MKPYVICHMLSSVDGRTQVEKWQRQTPLDLFEETAAKIKVDAWLVGRRTMEEFSSKKLRRKRKGNFDIPAGDFVAPHEAKTYAVAIDPHGKCHWETNMVNTEHVIEVLTEKVSADYLERLRAANVSYIFGGRHSLDLGLVLEKLHKLFGIRRLRIDGGGTVNGTFLKAGLIDELSLLLAPIADGAMFTPTLFDVEPGHTARKAASLRLESVRKLDKSVLWLRYKFVKTRKGESARATA